MGLDLRLLPIDGDSVPYSHQLLSLERAYDLFDKIKELPQMPTPPNLSSFNGYHPERHETVYGKTTQTPYGDELTYCLVRDLIKLRPDNHCALNCAAWAWLKVMADYEPLMKIALYWH